METFEWIIGLMMGAGILSVIARRLKVPYPALLAIGGASFALFPQTPNWTLDPDLSLALFLAPVLLDAAYDSSLRDLKRSWLSVSALAVAAVLITTAAVAIIAHALVPDLSWPLAIALGALVAPPDAAASTAVMRYVQVPHSVRTILEGESLVNDASALLLFRAALAFAAAENVSVESIAPALALSLVGSVAVGYGLSLVTTRVLRFVNDVPTSVMLQFVTTFGVWIIAENLHLSSILTIVVYAIATARSPQRLQMPAQHRVPTNAVWETVVFGLNALAFVLIGMQLGPILQRLGTADLWSALVVPVAVLITAIVARFAWVMAYTTVFSKLLSPGKVLGIDKEIDAGFTMKSGVVISWAGMRGIVTLAGAFSLPSDLPHRDLVLLAAFTVVLGTLVVQGLTLRPLISLLKLEAPDPVESEVRQARAESLQAALAVLDGDTSTEAKLLRREFQSAIETSTNTDTGAGLNELPGNEIRRTALAEARKKANELWRNGTIGDAAYRTLESEFDWGELSAGAAMEPL